MAIRVLSAGVELAALSEARRCGFYVWTTGSCRNSEGITKTLIVAGALGYAAGALYDIATASRAVDDDNQRLQLRVTPAVLPTASAAPAVGLGVGGAF